MEKHDLLIGVTIVLTILVFVNLFISFGGEKGMENVTGNVVASPELICNTPYIVNGNECCLDNNNNNICDDDEQIATEPAEENLDECTAKCPEGQVCKAIINKNNEKRYACAENPSVLIGSKDSL